MDPVAEQQIRILQERCDRLETLVHDMRLDMKGLEFAFKVLNKRFEEANPDPWQK